MLASSRALAGIVTLGLLVTACAPAPQRDAAPEPLAVARHPEKAAPTLEAPAPEAAAPKLTFVPDEALIETRDSRDPFRSFDAARPPTPTDARPRKSRHYALDELKLVGLVTSTATPRAMLLDPAGKGWIVTQGELVGKPEEVRSGGEVIVASWRVDRIRAGDVVLVREDPAHREGALATRVLAMPHEAAPQAIDD
jgi:type IV pilus assembly protein PilP